MHQLNESDLKTQLQEILSGIISTLDIYEVIDNGDTYDIINLKNNDIVVENIHLNVVADILSAAMNTGEELNISTIDKILEIERYAVSKMVEVKIYEELSDHASNVDKLAIYETKLTEAEHKSQNAINNLLNYCQLLISI
jgi:hypothetical protein|tara:strand:- start:43 stop:462 length:420 start_codon:yes stop_codon:yes gene_type:complete